MPDSPHVVRLNTESYAPTPEERALYVANGLTVLEIEAPSEIRKPLESVRALCTVSSKINRLVLEHLPSLRVISRFGSGTDNVDVDTATASGIVVTNVPDFCLSEVADHTMALLLAVARKLFPMDRAMRTGDWNARTTQPVHRITGKQLGLIGFGRIAQAVAIRARVFGLTVVAYDPALDEAACLRAGVLPTTLQYLLQSSHYVSLHAPLDATTRHMIGEEALHAMRPDAVLINTGRGALVDEEQLVAALRTGRIAGAALDVYEGLNVFGPAPKDLDHPLFNLSNVVLTPHSAGCSEESLSDLMIEGASNAVAVLQGRWPQNCVNPQVVPREPLTREVHREPVVQ